MDVTQEEQSGLTMSTDDDRLDKKNINFKTRNGVRRDKLIYGITDAPPIYVTLLCGLQTVLITLTSALFVSLLVAEVVCASHNEVFKAKLFSSTLVMNGFTTLAMNLVGVRLPLFQGAAGEYAVPLLLIGSIDKSFCSVSTNVEDQGGPGLAVNGTTNNTVDEIALERILVNVRSLQGSLMVAGVLHALVGLTGLVGYLLRYIGPITIVSSMFLLSVVLADACVGFVKGHWGIGLSTAAMGIILSVYLSDHQMPIPIWTPSHGFRIIRYPLHQVFALLIAVIINWIICGILTHTGMLTDDPTSAEYTTRTDARGSVVHDSSWFNIPYPGQYGMVSFSGAAFVAFFIATIISILDSMGDYFACARTCHVPAPPVHAVNRGILIEGLCTFLSGSVGCGHATTTYGDAIGALAITKVASRHVYICAGLLYILFGIVGKLSAAIITIPSPVLGGAAIIMFSTFLGVALSNLQVVSLSSSRNTTVLGIAIFLGLMIPMYVNKNDQPFNTGNTAIDRVLVMLFSNVNFCGPVLAFILDNTIPGSKEERGITAWQAQKDTDKSLEHDSVDKTVVRDVVERIDVLGTDSELYFPLFPRKILTKTFVKYMPFLPHLQRET